MNDEEFELIGDWPETGSSVVGLLMFDDQGRALMQLRDLKEGLVSAGKWSMFGGHMEEGETPLECIIREAMEETGTKIDASDLKPFIRFVKPVYEAARFYTFIKQTPVQPIDIRLGEGAGFGFLTQEQMDMPNFGTAAKMVLTHYFDSKKFA